MSLLDRSLPLARSSRLGGSQGRLEAKSNRLSSPKTPRVGGFCLLMARACCIELATEQGGNDDDEEERGHLVQR
jgi:hypothetical protein